VDRGQSLCLRGPKQDESWLRMEPGRSGGGGVEGLRGTGLLQEGENSFLQKRTHRAGN
jgi:hypothetical protein